MPNTIFKIEFYVPASHLEPVKEAMFEAGAGKVGDYDKCAWQTLGTGQYRPSADSSPYQGTVDKLETLEEFKVELVCDEDSVATVIEAMKNAHPYEEPAYAVIRLEPY